MKTVDRGDFTQKSGHAYQDSPQLIGYGVTISAPHMVNKKKSKIYFFAKFFREIDLQFGFHEIFGPFFLACLCLRITRRATERRKQSPGRWIRFRIFNCLFCSHGWTYWKSSWDRPYSKSSRLVRKQFEKKSWKFN